MAGIKLCFWLLDQASTNEEREKNIIVIIKMRWFDFSIVHHTKLNERVA